MKKLVSLAAALSVASMMFAYNPPVGGQLLFPVSSPNQLSGGNSSCGGAFFAPGPESIAANPALPSMEDRIQLDADFTALISTKTQDYAFNPAFELGILMPFKLFTVTTFLDGVFCNAQEMDIGNSFSLHAGLSKEITERISIGMNLNGGVMWKDQADWSVGCDLGVLYRRPSLGFMKDFRFGVAALNLGKYYSCPGLIGIDGTASTFMYPALGTVKTGIAATLFSVNGFRGAFSFDVTTPSFLNGIFDVALQFDIKDIVFISVAENLDIAEMCWGHYSVLPAVGVSVKFNFNASKSEYLKNHSWDKSEMLVSAAWQQRYDTVEVISGGVKVKLGQKDTTPPVIKLWEDDDEVIE